ncbi:hypothetical protein A3770_08p53220 [Chloropicon primus]|uniref:LysM domain-containing protein n=2 Tax=Chloropicon primus TaxID=1764295 RepID=A0A5B8MSB3_9CHLO|nr:hypothetical protein A3770_08p53220 [Chloropicon primus]|eukprot:QDZ22804.1 hypothetical protein A3770_08p53220 [Chloropicon primus]
MDTLNGTGKSRQKDSSSPATTSSSSSIITETEFFIFHKVSKLDTLAGIAIKYNVQVGELKRANGLHSDMSLFARDHVKIPRKKLHPSMYYKPESKASVGNGGGGLNLGGVSAGVAASQGSMSVAMTQLKSYYGTVAGEPGEPGEPGEGGSRAGFPEEGGRMDRGGVSGAGAKNEQQSFKPSLSHSGIVETIMKKQEESLQLKKGEQSVMMKSNGGKTVVVEEKGSNGAMVSDALIRKRGKDDGMLAGSSKPSNSPLRKANVPKSPSKDNGLVIRPPLFDSKKTAKQLSGAKASVSAASTQKKESFFEKIKKVANKPALPPARSSSGIKLIDLGEATLGSQNPLRTAKSDGGLIGKTKLRGKAD